MKNKVISTDTPSTPLTAKEVGALIGSMVPQRIVRRIPLDVILLIPVFLGSLPDKAEQMDCLTEIIKEVKTASISDLALVVKKIISRISEKEDTQLISDAIAKGFLADIQGDYNLQHILSLWLGFRFSDSMTHDQKMIDWAIEPVISSLRYLMDNTGLPPPQILIDNGLATPLPPPAPKKQII